MTGHHVLSCPSGCRGSASAREQMGEAVIFLCDCARGWGRGGVQARWHLGRSIRPTPFPSSVTSLWLLFRRHPVYYPRLLSNALPRAEPPLQGRAAPTCPFPLGAERGRESVSIGAQAPESPRPPPSLSLSFADGLAGTESGWKGRVRLGRGG